MISTINSIKARSFQYRLKRIKLFTKLLIANDITDASIIDIGGTLDFWNTFLPYIDHSLIRQIDVINLSIANEKSVRIGDIYISERNGNALLQSDYRNNYDIAFSNSVVEHVGSLRNQQLFANLIKNNSIHHFIQTPNKKFIVEPHFYMPYFQYYPISLQSFLHRNFNLGFMNKNSNYIESRVDCEETRLLTYYEIKKLFSTSTIYREYFCGLTKSFIITNLHS